MPRYTCACGARYRLPEGSGGRQARCKKCGKIFTIPADKPAPVAPPDDDYWDFEKHSSGPPPAGPSPSAPLPPTDSHGTGVAPSDSPYNPDELVAMGRAATAAPSRQRGFWADVGWTFGMFTEPGNLIMLIIIWFLHGILPYVIVAPCIGIICALIVYGWLCSYWFNVIVEAAYGEDSLPSLSLTEGLMDDVIAPLFKFLGASVLAWAPAIVCAVALSLITSVSFGQVTADPETLLVVLVAVSMFLWPMVLLVTAVGGLGAVFRLDLLAATVARTLLPYLAVCLLFAGAWALEQFAEPIASWITGGQISDYLITGILTALVQAYFSVVSMRIVGLYYHHFKERFAWSWG
ncbi:MAG: hypothetical protein GY778_26140 [bacterium]|nr:hypothetical protein [bacterium]